MRFTKIIAEELSNLLFDQIFLRFPPRSFKAAANVSVALNETKGRKVRLLTFGGGGKNYRDAVSRLKRQAASSNYFDEICAYTDCENTDCVKKLFEIHGKFINKYADQLGNFVWKPFLVNWHLKELRDGDVLVYLDPGCEISPLGKIRFAHYLDVVESESVYFSQVPRNEFRYSKPELFNSFELDKSDVNQVHATWFIIKANSQTRLFVKEWYELCIKNDYFHLDYERNHQQNTLYRYDQSVLSVLAKSKGIKAFAMEDHFVPYLYYRESWIFLAPFHTLRNRSGASRIDELVNGSSEKALAISLARFSSPLRIYFSFYYLMHYLFDGLKGRGIRYLKRLIA